MPKRVVKYQPKEIETISEQNPTSNQDITEILEQQSIPLEQYHTNEKRLALLIGNANYLHGGKLTNPVNDVRALEKVLQRLGFHVIRYENIDQQTMKQSIDMFGQKLRQYTVGLFYFSGHGVQVDGKNYLLPIDANLKGKQDAEYQCINAGRILSNMEYAETMTNIIILDACRNNPFERSWVKSGVGGGLAFMEAPIGSLIAYATSPGKVAYDDPKQANSVYTSALLQHIETPNITIIEMFQQVRATVRETTTTGQIPWESTSLTENFYFQGR